MVDMFVPRCSQDIHTRQLLRHKPGLVHYNHKLQTRKSEVLFSYGLNFQLHCLKFILVFPSVSRSDFFLASFTLLGALIFFNINVILYTAKITISLLND